MVAGAAIGAAWLFHKRERLAGTDSVEPSLPVAVLKQGQRLCVRDLLVPSSANLIRFNLSPASPANVSVALTTVSGVRSTSSQTVTHPTYVDFPITRAGHASGGVACIRSSVPVEVIGSPGIPATIRPQAFLEGKPVQGRVSVWFYDTKPRSLFSLLGTAARRASVFRAGFVGAWTYLLAALLLPVLWWWGLRTLLRGVE
jgi:hypothetical protein